MLNRMIGRNSAVSMLKEGLDASATRARQIAHRVANASTPNGGGFAGVLDKAQVLGPDGQPLEQVDLEAEMVALADEQIRFEAAARLLQKVYQQVRASVRER
jgi:flagellar basal body rod protein FlgB